MKIFNWIKLNRYPIMVVLFFIAVIICLVIFFQSLKKDNSLDMAKFQLKTLEDTRINIEAAREPLLDIIAKQNETITILQERDTELKQSISNLENRIDNLPKQYHEKAKAINNFSDAELQQYFNSLPVQPDNDY